MSSPSSLPVFVERWLDRLAVEQTILVQSGVIFPLSVFLATRWVVEHIFISQPPFAILGQKLFPNKKYATTKVVLNLLPFFFYYFRLLVNKTLTGPLSPQFLGTGQAGRGWRGFPRYKRAARYFGMTLHKAARDYSDDNYLFAVHPHGVFCLSALLGLSTNGCGFDDDPDLKHLDVRFAVADFPFLVPGMREYALNTGAISPCAAALCKNFSAQKSVAVIPGGVDEALLAGAADDKMRLVLKNRKGFVKCALLAGVKIVPVLSFGENALYPQIFVRSLAGFQQWQRKTLGFAVPIVGRADCRRNPFGLAPTKRKITMVLGEPFCPVQYLGPMFPTRDDVSRTTTSRGGPAIAGAGPRPGIKTVLAVAELSVQRLDAAVVAAHAGYLEHLRKLHARYAKKFGARCDQQLEFVSVSEARSAAMLERMMRTPTAKL